MKSTNSKKDNNIFKSRFFFELFVIPSIMWIILSILVMIDSMDSTDKLTIGELIMTDFALILIWFVISIIVIKVSFILKKSFSKKTKDNDEGKSVENKRNVMKIEEYPHSRFIKNGMIILFIVTIASLWLALASLSIVNVINPQHGFNFTKNTWVFWCFLPIPILSIILGFKYKRAGFKCTKNIVGGFIIAFLLIVYGAFCLMPTFSVDYDEIDKYRDIVDAELPSNGELEIQDWDTYFDEDKTEYSIIYAYYNKENVNDLVSSIENSNNWILSKDIKSVLRIFIPSTLYSDADAYYSIYNKTTGQYNSLPEVAGDYEIYAMKYDISDKHLEIHKFKYSYKK